MRILVFVLAIAAFGKVYVHYNFYRTAADAAIISAYRPAAVRACQKSQRDMSNASATYLWREPSEISVEVGQDSLNVSLWEIEHPKWDERYRRASLVLAPHDPLSPLTCRYDITSGIATISSA